MSTFSRAPTDPGRVTLSALGSRGGSQLGTVPEAQPAAPGQGAVAETLRWLKDNDTEAYQAFLARIMER